MIVSDYFNKLERMLKMSVHNDLLNDEMKVLHEQSSGAPESAQMCSSWQDESGDMCSSWQDDTR